MRRRRKPQQKRDADALELRRLEGAKLLTEGLNHSQVARRLSVSRQAVIKWEKRLKKRSSLAKKPPGPKPLKLTKKQLAILREEIEKRPEECFPEEYFVRAEKGFSRSYRDGKFRKYKDGRWTGPLIARLIADKLGSIGERVWPVSALSGKKILKFLRAGSVT